MTNSTGKPEVAQHLMAGGRIAEHVGAVAERRDHQPLRRGDLHADGGADAPAETARASAD